GTRAASARSRRVPADAKKGRAEQGEAPAGGGGGRGEEEGGAGGGGGGAPAGAEEGRAKQGEAPADAEEGRTMEVPAHAEDRRLAVPEDSRKTPSGTRGSARIRSESRAATSSRCTSTSTTPSC